MRPERWIIGGPRRSGSVWPRAVRRSPQLQTGALTAREVFPARLAFARGRGAIAVTTVALAAFATLFTIVKRQRSSRLDLAVTVALQRRQSPWFRRVMELVSWPGFPPQSRLIAPALALAWLALGFPLEAAFQFAGWGTNAISFAVKQLVRRPRPAAPDVAITVARLGGTSFPSGHVLNYVGVYGTLAFLVTTLVRPLAIRRALQSLLLGLVGLVGPSRIYLGHHWLTDVTASYLLGTAYLLGLGALYRRLKLRVMLGASRGAGMATNAAAPMSHPTS